MTGEKAERRKRWTLPEIRNAATVARDFGVTVRLERDGAITIGEFDSTAKESPLEKWKSEEAARRIIKL